MTFQEGGSFDSSRVRRRSGGARKGGIAVGGGLGAVALFVVAQLLGVDLSGFVGQGGASGQAQTETDLTGCETADRANTDSECRYGWTIEALDAYWASTLPEQTGVEYTPPAAVSFTGSVSTGCGSATSATGPFYCPADETVYVDAGFFAVLRDQFGASGGPLAEQYVVAHEVGHHIEQITGAMSSAERSGSRPESDSVRIELMADCLAGMWAGAASRTIDPDTGAPFLEPITPDQLADALSAAEAVGDDRIQEAASGRVDPEAWTHGSAEQRQRWFTVGYEGGTFEQCNALEAAEL